MATIARIEAGHRQEPGVLHGYPTWVTRTQQAEPSSSAFQGPLAGSWIEVGQLGYKLVWCLHGMLALQAKIFPATHHSTDLAPHNIIINSGIFNTKMIITSHYRVHIPISPNVFSSPLFVFQYNRESCLVCGYYLILLYLEVRSFPELCFTTTHIGICLDVSPFIALLKSISSLVWHLTLNHTMLSARWTSPIA